MKKNAFLLKYKEKADLNQYWYSQPTIEFLAAQALSSEGLICLLSCPSVYFSLDPKDRERAYLFDLDKGFQKQAKGNFVFYDFNYPQSISKDLHGKFSFVLIDPPFITKQVWTLYSKAVRLLSSEHAKVLGSTIDQNQQLLNELLGLKKKVFRPSIPHLVYQYSLFSNYENQLLDETNPQIGF